MLLYGFKFGDSLNPTIGALYVCIDKDGRIVGWMYIKTLEGHETEARRYGDALSIAN